MPCCLIFQLPHWYHFWVLHAAARTVLDRRPCGHVTMALQELHWLPVAERIQYKLLCLMVHKSLLSHMPVCISDLLTSVPTIPAQSALCALLCNVLATRLSLSPHCEHGTGCRESWDCCDQPLLFVVNWKHFCSSLRLSTDTGIQTDDCFVMHPQSSVGGTIQVTQLQPRLLADVLTPDCRRRRWRC